ncbi:MULTISPECIES: leucyl aminopeptidase [Thalassospira]|uniref:Probable cytosol aminopeptidase n=2 Tax=Thalassospira TaxID=168934 RepID=A0A367W6B9_9PROT|nr:MULTISPECIES: leucyl aminopeptidase [Thalassospira]MDG4719032.1 leucyl aminopeptidase [Thalassospira sp. FZY0004]RCK36975.1 aminopeptidase A [Thalassospira profundimaris]
MKITFSDLAIPSGGAVIAFATEGADLMPSAVALDEATGGSITRAIKASTFKGKAGQSLQILAPANVELSRVIVFGIGKEAEFDVIAAQKLGGSVTARALSTGEKEVSVLFDMENLASDFATGAMLRDYRFDKYRTTETKEDKPVLKSLDVATRDHKEAKKQFDSAKKVVEGVFFTRDLVSEPANVLYPETFTKEVMALEKLGVEIDVLDEKEMKKLGMGALLGVAMGSAKKPAMVVMRWNGGKKKDAPIAFVGKGVTFDTGGISIKPAAGMEDMKWDMGGAGVVSGLMKALAGRKAKCNVVAVLGLVENMPSSTAQRPGDVVTSMSGQTIEVINTDAEGRLVLCDALTYVQEKYDPRLIVDLATLTGAVIIALGHENAGLFSNNDDLAAQISTAGLAVDEGVWRLPLSPAYDKQLKSDIADMKNVGGRPAGSITAAQFLKRFITKDRPWAHLDIAAMAWSTADKEVVPKGGTGFGVRLLDRFVADNYEN